MVLINKAMGMNCYMLNREPNSGDLFCDYIRKTAGLNLVGCSGDPVEAIRKTGREDVMADVLFLDGELLSAHREAIQALVRYYSHIIVMSAHQDFAAEAFELNAVDYLQSPVSYERFLKGMDKVKEKSGRVKPLVLQPELPYFFIRSDGKGKLTRIIKADIVFVESALNYLRIHLDKAVHSTYLMISEMEDKLSERQFIRVHKSFIINMDKINSIEGNMIHLDNGKTIVLGPNYRKEFFERIGLALLTSKRQA